MQRRKAFTLVELLVAIGLIVLVLAVLAEAFAVGLGSFRTLKGIGDMSDRLRATAHLLRRDLAADHFEGSLRLSDPDFGRWKDPTASWRNLRPQAGFFVIKQFGPSVLEGFADGIPTYRAPSMPGRSHVLYMTCRLKGNKDEDFFTADVPAGWPFMSYPDLTTNYSQPEDARRQEGPSLIYNSQWAEVAYFLQPLPVDENARGTTLYSLHRMVRVMVPERRNLNNIVPRTDEPGYFGFSYEVPSGSTFLRFLTPYDAAPPTKPGFWSGSTWVPPVPPKRSLWRLIILQDPTAATSPRFAGTETMLMTDVVSFTVQVIQRPGINPRQFQPGFGFPMGVDFADVTPNSSGVRLFDSGEASGGLSAVRIILRVWDVKTSQTRQITIIQDL